jgi:ribosomal protein S4
MRLVKRTKKIYYQTRQPVLGSIRVRKLNLRKWFWYKMTNTDRVYSTKPKLKRNMTIYPRRRQKPETYFALDKSVPQPKSLRRAYKTSLLERQMLKIFYGGLTDKYIKKIYKGVRKSTKRNTMNRFFECLESRLDVSLFRAKLAKSVSEARQLINHKKVALNGKAIKMPSQLINKLDWFNKLPTPGDNVIVKTNLFLKGPTYPFKLRSNLIERHVNKN